MIGKSDKMELIEAIKKRKTHRDKFLNKPIKKEHLDLIIEAARLAPSPFNTQHWKLLFITEKEGKEKLADLTAKCVVKQFKDSRFLDGIGKWMRLTVEEWKDRGDGVLIDHHVTLPEQIRDRNKLRPLLKKSKHFSLFGYIGAGKIPAKEIAELIRSSPLLLLILMDKNRKPPFASAKTWMLLGMGMLIENIMLAATSVGIGTHLVSGSLEEKQDRDEIKEFFSLSSNYEPIELLRMGYADQEYESVRLDPSNFVEFRR